MSNDKWKIIRLFLRLTNHVTQSIRSYHEENAMRHVAGFVEPKVRVRRWLALNLLERRCDVVDFKEAAILVIDRQILESALRQVRDLPRIRVAEPGRSLLNFGGRCEVPRGW